MKYPVCIARCETRATYAYIGAFAGIGAPSTSSPSLIAAHSAAVYIGLTNGKEPLRRCWIDAVAIIVRLLRIALRIRYANRHDELIVMDVRVAGELDIEVEVALVVAIATGNPIVLAGSFKRRMMLIIVHRFFTRAKNKVVHRQVKPTRWTMRVIGLPGRRANSAPNFATAAADGR